MNTLDEVLKALFRHDLIERDAKVMIERLHELQLKEVAKNVRHKAAEIVNGDSSLHSMLHKEIMNIQFEDVKPK